MISKKFTSKSNYNPIFKQVFILLMINILMMNFTGCQKNITFSENDRQKVIDEVKTLQTGAFTEIAYASSDTIIINGDVGLIVYDTAERKITGAINLKNIDMNHIQGDVVTIFSINEDGSKIYMYNNALDQSSSEYYLYDVPNDTLMKTDSIILENKYNGPHWLSLDVDNPDYSIPDYINKYSDLKCIDYAFISENKKCFLLYPIDDEGHEGVSNIKIIFYDEQTNNEEVYDIFK